MKIQIKLTYSGMPAQTVREMQRHVQDAWHDVGVYWHDRFRPRHFTAAAWTLYDYTPRSKKYWWRKLKKTGQALPLVFTGEARSMSKSATITATPHGVRIAMPVQKLNFKPKTKGKKPPNMADELTQINSQEFDTLKGVLVKSIRRELRAAGKRVRVNIGG